LGISFACILALAACDDEAAAVRGAPGSTIESSEAAVSETAHPNDELAQVPPETSLPEGAFIPSERNRDPFQSSLGAFRPDFPPPITRDLPVVLRDRRLSELRLSGIVSAADGRPRAMLVDSNGVGYTVGRGDYVGSAERTARLPGEAPVRIHWRVERIRPDRVIFVREDPLRPEAQTVQVMRLHPNDDEPLRKEIAV